MIAPLTLIRVIDTETTGMEEGAQVCEIGWTDVRFFPTGWAIDSGPHAELCGITVPMEPDARAAHHIDPAELEGLPPFEEVRPLVMAGADYMAAHHVAFDGQFFPGSRIEWICTMKCAAALWPDLPSHGNQAIRYARELQVDAEKSMPPHRGGPDSFVTAHILVDLLSQVDPKTGEPYPLDAFVKVSAQPRRILRFKFGKHRGALMSEVPADYLEWIIEKSELDEETKWNAQRELGRRRREAACAASA